MTVDAASLERESDTILCGACDCEPDIDHGSGCECGAPLMDILACDGKFDMGPDDFVEFLRGEFDFPEWGDYEEEANVQENQDPLGYAQWMGDPRDRPKWRIVERASSNRVSAPQAPVFEQPSYFTPLDDGPERGCGRC